jgi:predicted  nucleic acid-binding Zn-ribbon protein
MPEEQRGYEEYFLTGTNTKLRDLEGKQRMLKDRILLIGQNLVEMREKTEEDVLEIKKDLETMKTNMERLISFLETASAEFSKFAKKEDLEILSKQAKMFQPLDLTRKKGLKKLKN